MVFAMDNLGELTTSLKVEVYMEGELLSTHDNWIQPKIRRGYEKDF